MTVHNGPVRWPIVLAAFATGLALAFVLPTRSGGSSARQPDTLTTADASPTTDAEGSAEDLRTEDGAIEAAAAFICSGQALLDMDPLAADKAIRALAASAAADELSKRHLAQLARVREVLASGNGPTTYRQAAIAWRLDGFTKDRARVVVWNVGVLSHDGVAPPQASWTTSVVDLVWEQRTWRVWGESVTPGPTPINDDSDAPATSKGLAAALDGFQDFGGTQ